MSMDLKLRYYLGSMVFLSGLIISIAGIGFGIFVNLMWTSDPIEIMTTYSLVGIGFSLTLLGINLMISKQRPYGLYSNIAMVTGFILSIAGVIYFLMIFQDNWVYPYATYLVILYASGISLLSGNAFANAVLRVIGEPSENLSTSSSNKNYSLEDIEKEVEKTLSQSYSTNNTNFSSFDLGVKEDDTSFVPCKTFKSTQQERIEVEDFISEAKNLQTTMTGKVETGDYGLELTTKMLSETMKEKERDQNKSIFNKFKTKFNNKRK